MGQREGAPNSFLVSKPLTASQTSQKSVLSSPPHSAGLPWLPLCELQEWREKLLWAISTISSLTDTGKRHHRSWWGHAEATFFPGKPQQLSKSSVGYRIKTNPKPGTCCLSVMQDTEKLRLTSPPQEKQMSPQYIGAHPKACGLASCMVLLMVLSEIWLSGGHHSKQKLCPKTGIIFLLFLKNKSHERSPLSGALETTWIKIWS